MTVEITVSSIIISLFILYIIIGISISLNYYITELLEFLNIPSNTTEYKSFRNELLEDCLYLIIIWLPISIVAIIEIYKLKKEKVKKVRVKKI